MPDIECDVLEVSVRLFLPCSLLSCLGSSVDGAAGFVLTDSRLHVQLLSGYNWQVFPQATESHPDASQTLSRMIYCTQEAATAPTPTKGLCGEGLIPGWWLTSRWLDHECANFSGVSVTATESWPTQFSDSKTAEQRWPRFGALRGQCHWLVALSP